jgi:hypothetical protein
VPTPSAYARRLEVLPRALARDGDGWRAVGGSGRDHAWLGAEDWRQLLPANARVGDRIRFPEAVARKLARYHLLDATRGEAWAWEDRHLRALELTLVVEESTPARQRLRIEGSARLEAHERAYAPTIAGTLTAESGRITDFRLVAIGEHRGDDAYQPTDRPSSGPLGIAIRLAGDQPWDFVPPHGMRDEDYRPAP